MTVHAGAKDKGLEEFPPDILFLSKNQGWQDLVIINKKRPAGNIQDNFGQGFIHRDFGPSNTGNPGFISQASKKNFPQTQPNIFQSVMSVNLQISCGLYLQIKTCPKS